MRQTALAQFCVDLTARASEGRIDPVIGRHPEIERIVPLLCRRTENTPPPPKDLCLLFFYIYKYWFRLYLKYGSIGVFWKFEILFFYLKLFFLFFQNRNWYHIHKYIFKHLKIFKPIKKIWQVQCFLYQLHILGFGRSEKKTR